MTRNPVLFPDTFGSGISRLPIGRFGDEGATTAWVKQMIVEMFYGRGVPLFYFDETSVSWGDGNSYFDGIVHPIAMGSYLFEPLDSGWYYVYAQQEGGEIAEIVVSGSPPVLAAQQLWWNLMVVNGLIVDVIPAKIGFGV